MYMLATECNAFVGRQLHINGSTLPYQSEPCRFSYTINSSKQREHARDTPDGSKVSVQQPPSTTARRQLRIKTNWFINSVAVADLSVWGVIPNMFLYDVKLGSSGDIQGQFFIRLLFSYASLTNVCSLVLDRYIAFAKPLKYSTCMTAGRRVFHIIFFSQAISFCLVTTLVLL